MRNCAAMNLAHLFATNGGVMTSAMLQHAGLTRHYLAKLVEGREIVRLRPGYYSHPQVTWTHLGRARAVGGAVSCVTLLAEAKVWTPDTRALHLRVPKHNGTGWDSDPRPHRFARGAQLHVDRAPIRQRRDDLSTAVRIAAGCVDRVELVAILDSLARAGRATRAALDVLAADAKIANLSWAIAKLDTNAGSGLESIVRMHFKRLRLKFATQVWIGKWPCDFLIGDRLVIEIDGFEYHSKQEDFGRDRVKDRELQWQGYIVLRFTYWDVMLRWEYCEQEILKFVRAGMHRRAA